MKTAPVDPARWRPGRLWAAIALVMTVQVAFIWFLSNRSPISPKPAPGAPLVRIVGDNAEEWLALQDPTLYVLPHRQGFSGPAWLSVPPLQFEVKKWTEPATGLLLDPADLGAVFRAFVASNTQPPFDLITATRPALTMPDVAPVQPISIPSNLRLEGDLRNRMLLSKIPLPALTNLDLQTNSVVQLLVDAPGNTISAILLPPGSGSKEADQRALAIARSTRFAPIGPSGRHPQNPSAALTIGTMIFEWQLPLPATNATGGEIR